ncbi:MAG: TylF/MycF/NovP-related O-methyltransferase [Ferruginibacter sp.]
MKIIEGINYLLGGLFNKNKVRINQSLNYLNRDRVIDRNYMDYIRLSSLELIANEIYKNKIPGAVAELGVYKGKFARYINLYFADRKLYLFDTFKGFDEKDINAEIQNTFSSGGQDFSNTSVTKVLSIMPNPANCIIKEGFFPETANGLEEEFAFVSIDADLFEPIYKGLEYFYPRLKKGGFIFIHDYNNDLYKGARQAVDKYCLEKNLNKFPLPDSGGTAVIVK